MVKKHKSNKKQLAKAETNMASASTSKDDHPKTITNPELNRENNTNSNNKDSDGTVVEVHQSKRLIVQSKHAMDTRSKSKQQIQETKVTTSEDPKDLGNIQKSRKEKKKKLNKNLKEMQENKNEKAIEEEQTVVQEDSVDTNRKIKVRQNKASKKIQKETLKENANLMSALKIESEHLAEAESTHISLKIPETKSFTLNPNAAIFQPTTNCISGFDIPQTGIDLADTTQAPIVTNIAVDRNAENRLHLERLKIKSKKQMETNKMKIDVEKEGRTYKRQLRSQNRNEDERYRIAKRQQTDDKNHGISYRGSDRNRPNDRTREDNEKDENTGNYQSHVKGGNYNRDSGSDRCQKDDRSRDHKNNNQNQGQNRKYRNDKSRDIARTRGNNKNYSNVKPQEKDDTHLSDRDHKDQEETVQKYHKPEREPRQKNKNWQHGKLKSEFVNRERLFRNNKYGETSGKTKDSFSETSKQKNQEKKKHMEQKKEKESPYENRNKQNLFSTSNLSNKGQATSTPRPSFIKERSKFLYHPPALRQDIPIENWREENQNIEESASKTVERGREWYQWSNLTGTSPKISYFYNTDSGGKEMNWRQQSSTEKDVKTGLTARNIRKSGNTLTSSSGGATVPAIGMTPNTSKLSPDYLVSNNSEESGGTKETRMLNDSQRSKSDTFSSSFTNSIRSDSFFRKSDSSFNKSFRKSVSLLETTLDKELQKSDTGYNEFLNVYKEINEYRVVQEITGDIFAQPSEYSLAHCVAEDLRMGSGLAIDFKRNFRNLPELLNQRAKQGGLAMLEDAKNDRFIYYLITKRESTAKPSYGTLWQSLCKMRCHIRENLVEKLAIPRLGCGLDRLEWNIVKPMLEFIFRDTDLEIVVCNLDKSEETESTRRRSFTCHVVTEEIPITEIDTGTVIFYFSTQNNYCDAIMEKLAEKFNFMPQFNNEISKRLGQLIRYEDPSQQYLLCGCVVRKSEKDKLNFTSFSKCLQEFNRINKKYGNDAYQYVAFQQMDGETEYFDDLINQKIITMMVNQLKGVSVHFCKGVL